ncbi:MAG: hypothetical protein KBT35_03710 [Firmicutes bacterium]|nr:hypothetical protein [Candidatus Colivicinus equi]
MNCSWNQRYRVSIQENVTVKDICVLCGVSTQNALNIRHKAIDYLKENFRGKEFLEPKSKVDIEAVFAVTGKDSDYYYRKMLAERKADNNG